MSQEESEATKMNLHFRRINSVDRRSSILLIYLDILDVLQKKPVKEEMNFIFDLPPDELLVKLTSIFNLWCSQYTKNQFGQIVKRVSFDTTKEVRRLFKLLLKQAYYLSEDDKLYEKTNSKHNQSLDVTLNREEV